MKSSRRDFIKTNAGTGVGSANAPGLGAAKPQRLMAMPRPRTKTLMSLFGLTYSIQADVPMASTPHVTASSLSSSGGAEC